MNQRTHSYNEEEYFLLEEAEKKFRLAQARAKELATEERNRLKELHAMHCPKCGLLMEELTYRDMQVERCFSCHGIFLDERDIERLTQHSMWSKILHFFSKRY
jgi:hypothetical protein